MADKSRPRRISRHPIGRPRKVAGPPPQGPPARDRETPAADPVVEQRAPAGDPDPVVEQRAPASDPDPVVEQRAPAGDPDPVVEQRAPASDVETPAPGAPAEARSGGGLGGRRTTIGLLVVVLVLLGVGAAEVVYLTRDATPTISASRPVVTGELTHRAAVEAAARSTEEVLSTSYEDYDEQVDQAAAKMTDTFAEQYRETSEAIRDSFVRQRTKLQVKAIAQGVVQASPAQVQALLFLDQYVEKVEKGQPRTDYRQYRALVTVVHTDHGWLLDSIETQ